MFSLVFPLLVLSTSLPLIDALVCGTNCTVSGQIGSVPIPRCDEIDKPATEQSCRVHIAIDYFSNEITGYLKPGLPASHNSISIRDRDRILTLQRRIKYNDGLCLFDRKPL